MRLNLKVAQFFLLKRKIFLEGNACTFDELNIVVMCMEVFNNLGALIKNSPYKRKYIEQKLGVTRNTLSNWITNKSYPTVIQVLLLAEIFDCSVEDIYKIKKENDE